MSRIALNEVVLRTRSPSQEGLLVSRDNGQYVYTVLHREPEGVEDCLCKHIIDGVIDITAKTSAKNRSFAAYSTIEPLQSCTLQLRVASDHYYDDTPPGRAARELLWHVTVRYRTTM